MFSLPMILFECGVYRIIKAGICMRMYIHVCSVRMYTYTYVHNMYAYMGIRYQSAYHEHPMSCLLYLGLCLGGKP